MKIAVFGATGKTGLEIVNQAIERGHTVTAFVRDSSRIQEKPGVLNVITGDINDLASVEQCVNGQEAVICALGTKDLFKNSQIRTKGTANIIKAMKKSDVKRLIVMSAMGVGDSWKSLSLMNRLLFAVLMPATREDHESQEVEVRGSGLDWTIIRPSGLTDKARTGKYMVGENISSKKSQISRADVADLILNVMESKEHIHEALTITN